MHVKFKCRFHVVKVTSTIRIRLRVSTRVILTRIILIRVTLTRVLFKVRRVVRVTNMVRFTNMVRVTVMVRVMVHFGIGIMVRATPRNMVMLTAMVMVLYG